MWDGLSWPQRLCLPALLCGFILIWAARYLRALSLLSCIPGALHSPLFCCAWPQAAPGPTAAPISSMDSAGFRAALEQGLGKDSQEAAQPSRAPRKWVWPADPSCPAESPPRNWYGVGEQPDTLHKQLELGTNSCWAQLRRLALWL